MVRKRIRSQFVRANLHQAVLRAGIRILDLISRDTDSAASDFGTKIFVEFENDKMTDAVDHHKRYDVDIHFARLFVYDHEICASYRGSISNSRDLLIADLNDSIGAVILYPASFCCFVGSVHGLFILEGYDPACAPLTC
jgi:hypothetical protein